MKFGAHSSDQHLFSGISCDLAFVWITHNVGLCEAQQTGKFLKRWEYHTVLSASWEICMQIKKQQLEPDME